MFSDARVIIGAVFAAGGTIFLTVGLFVVLQLTSALNTRANVAPPMITTTKVVNLSGLRKNASRQTCGWIYRAARRRGAGRV